MVVGGEGNNKGHELQKEQGWKFDGVHGFVVPI